MIVSQTPKTHGAYHSVKQPCLTIFPLASSLTDYVNLSMKWLAYVIASAQNTLLSLLFDSKYCIFSSKVRLNLSTTPFCCRVPFTVKCRSMPSSWHNYRNGITLVLFSIIKPKYLDFSACLQSILFFYSTKYLGPHSFATYCTPNQPRVTNKGDKVVFFSMRFILRGTSNICMHIIKNSSGTVNSGTKLHLHFLVQYIVLRGF